MSTKHLAMVLACLAACGTTGNNGGPADGPNSPDAPGHDMVRPFTLGVSTLAGWGDPGYMDGTREVALFANPVNAVYGPDGKVYVADFDNGKIRVVDEMGNTSTVVSQAGFRRPFAMAFSSTGTLYVVTDDSTQGHSDMSGTVWKVDVHAQLATPIVESIGRPRGIAVLLDGKLAISDYVHHVIEYLDPDTGVLTKLAGTWDAKGMVDAVGAAARFSTPYGLVVRNGALIVADYDNNLIRSVAMDGTVTTLAGGTASGFTDGPLTAARFAHPQAVAVDTAGDLYVTDVDNYRVRRIHGNTVDTLVGDGTPGYLDSDNLLSAELFGLEGLAVKPDGTMLFIADGGRGEDVPHNYVREAKLQK